MPCFLLNQSLTLIYHKNGYAYPVVHISGLWIFSRKSYPPVDNFIEDNIVLKVLTRFQIKPRQILWDTTSFYFEGNYEESDIITFGYSRDQKKNKTVQQIGNVSSLMKQIMEALQLGPPDVF